MARNVEIKARARDPEALRRRARELSGRDPVLIEQEDTFFEVPRGRMKLRRFSSSRGELIVYDRPDSAGPRTSRYRVVSTGEPEELGRALETALGAAGVVRKRRWLSLAGRTRIHLDEVEGLGHFVELEVVLRPGEPLEDGEAEARSLMDSLGIREEDLVDRAYVDLLRDSPGGSG